MTHRAARPLGTRAARSGRLLTLVATALALAAAPSAAQLVVDFSAVPTSGTNPLSVTFTDLTTGGTPDLWGWSFGDGGTSNLPDPTHVYDAPGTYSVQLIVVAGTTVESELKANLVTVAPAQLDAAFSASSTGGVNPVTVSFTDLSTASSPITGRLWDFGDGTISSLQHPVHTYTLPGTHTVSLTTFVGQQSDTEVVPDLVTVTPAGLTAAFQATAPGGIPTTAEDSLVVSFTDTSTASSPITDWAWSFGDGTTSTQQHPIHVYGPGGPYDVTLQVAIGQQTDTLVTPGLVPVISDTVPQATYFKASNSDILDGLGEAIAMSGDTLVAGARGEDGNGTDPSDNSAGNAGAAYVFVRDGTSWSQQAYLKPEVLDVSDLFGSSVAVSGDTIVVGAPFEDGAGTGVGADPHSNGVSAAGAAYVFVRDGTSWIQEAYLKAPLPPGSSDQLGWSVAVDGDTVAVGAPRSDVSGSLDAGAVFLYERSGGSWSFAQQVTAAQAGLSDGFGERVALSGDLLVVGAPREDGASTGVGGDPASNGATDSGAVYVFERSPGSAWTQTAYVKASNTGVGDTFGASVAASGDTFAVGAPFEDSGATGVGGDGADDGLVNAGAAYVFVRDGASWSQQAYVKALDPDAGDGFGTSVALDGDEFLVGAPFEDDWAIGVNGQPLGTASASGAAYGLDRVGTTWSQRFFIKGLAQATGDFFGTSVAVADHTFAAGAYSEDGGGTTVGANPFLDGKSGAGAVFAYGPWRWGGLGGGSPGVAGVPRLDVQGPLDTGSTLSMTLDDTPPGAPALLWASTSSAPLSVFGGTLHAFPKTLQVFLVTDANGSASLSTTVGPNIPPGVDLHLQCIVQDLSVLWELTLSDAKKATTP